MRKRQYRGSVHEIEKYGTGKWGKFIYKKSAQPRLLPVVLISPQKGVQKERAKALV